MQNNKETVRGKDTQEHGQEEESLFKKTFNDIVSGYNDLYNDLPIEIKGFWKDRKNRGLIKVCGENNIVHRIIQANVEDDELKFYNWLDQERDLEKEIALGVQRAKEE